MLIYHWHINWGTPTIVITNEALTFDDSTTKRISTMHDLRKLFVSICVDACTCTQIYKTCTQVSTNILYLLMGIL